MDGKNIEIGGTTHLISYDFNSMADLNVEAAMGLRPLFQKEMEFAVVRLLVWAGLRTSKKHANLTLAQAGALCGQYLKDGKTNTLETLALTCMEAMKACGFLPETEDEEEANP